MYLMARGDECPGGSECRPFIGIGNDDSHRRRSANERSVPWNQSVASMPHQGPGPWLGSGLATSPAMRSEVMNRSLPVPARAQAAVIARPNPATRALPQSGPAKGRGWDGLLVCLAMYFFLAVGRFH